VTGPSGPEGATGPSGPSGPCGIGTATLNGGTNSANLSVSSTNYASLVAQTNPNTTTTNGNATVICGGTLLNLSVTLSGTPNNGGGTQTYAFTVMVNGVASALTCTVSENNTTCSFNTNVTLVAGNTVNVQSVPSGTPTARSATWSTSYAQGGAPIQ